MIENRNPRCDLFAVILAILALFLTVSLLTYNAADPVGKLVSPLDKIYQADVLVWPQNNEIKNACGHWGAITADLLFTTMGICLLYTSPSPRDQRGSRMPSSA